MILLDTNVISAMMQLEPDATVTGWLDRQPSDSIWVPSVTVMEVRFGLLTMRAGRKKDALTKAFQILLEEKIQQRIAAFDVAAAEEAAELMASRKRKGRAVEIRDTIIAGIALANRAALATHNTSHFQDLSVPVINPWTA